MWTIICILLAIIIVFGFYIWFHLDWCRSDSKLEAKEGDDRQILIDKLNSSFRELDFTDCLIRAVGAGLVASLLVCYLLVQSVSLIPFILLAILITVMFYMVQRWVLIDKKHRQNKMAVAILASM